MSEHVKPRSRSVRFAPSFASFLALLVLLVAMMMVWSQDRSVTLGLLSAACVLTLGMLVSGVRTLANNSGQKAQIEAVQFINQIDQRPVIMSDYGAEVLWKNTAAHASFSRENNSTVVDILDATLPNAAGVVRRFTAQARRDGSHTERILAASGAIDLQVMEFAERLIWKIAFESNEARPADVESAMLTVGRKGTILHMNAAARSLIGQRVMSISRLFQPQTDPTSKVKRLATKDGAVRVLVREQKLQNDRSQIFLTPVEDDATGGEFMLGDLPVPLLRLSVEGEVEQANDAALELLGYKKLVGLSMAEVFEGPGLAVDEWISRIRGSTRSVDAEFLRVRGAKKETFVQVSLQRVGGTGRAKIVAVLTDATKLKSLEAQFVQSQKMQAIGQLAGGVAHDFNNLLTAISGHCDLILLRHDPGDLDYADLMQIHQNANRAAGLVSQLLAFSRKQTLKPEQLDLRNTLSDLTHLLNRLVGETVTLTLSHDPVLKPVRADKRQLEQVIMNLVVNARDAMPEGGEITIETESLTLSNPTRRQRVVIPSGDYVVVRVRDVGTGIETEALQKIFEPFYTTKRTGEGTGLGLSTAYGIVKQTGGYIFADSELGQGTCFSLLFPASERPAEKPIVQLAEPPNRIGEQCSGVVLLVEDEAPVRAFASRALRMRGFEVIEAECAEEALELLEDTSLHVDVFVTDVVMPGMDGPTWVARALKERPAVNVVFVSGYAEGAFQGGTPEVENSVFLPKPFSLTDLTSTVQNQLN